MLRFRLWYIIDNEISYLNKFLISAKSQHARNDVYESSAKMTILYNEIITEESGMGRHLLPAANAL